MKLRTTILLMGLLLHARADTFYVWQQVWTSDVLAAVSAEAPTSLYPLAAVIPEKGHCTLVDIPWIRLSSINHHFVPVIRIPLNAFKRADIADELSAVTRHLLKTSPPCSVKEIQLDLDCPERLLPEYRALVMSYRNAWPNLRLTITALPAHLNNKAFRPLAECVDYYVLQVHGLEVPDNIDDPAELLNLQTAERAIRQAEELGLPYRIALPCYAYELNFDPDTGSFLFLTAEHPARRRKTIKRRIAADPADLLALQQEMKSLKHATGIIWFRLPVEGDRLCLTRTDLSQLQQGLVPADAVECRVHPISDSTIELELVNQNTIHSAAITLKLHWPQPEGAYDLYQQVINDASVPGRLPTELTIPMPIPGKSVKIGWFQSAQPSTLAIELL